MPRNRAERRHHHFRMRNKTRNFVANSNWFHTEGIEYEVCRRTENRKKCSCVLCGNPRKHFNEPTKQEMIWELRENDSY